MITDSSHAKTISDTILPLYYAAALIDKTHYIRQETLTFHSRIAFSFALLVDVVHVRFKVQLGLELIPDLPFEATVLHVQDAVSIAFQIRIVCDLNTSTRSFLSGRLCRDNMNCYSHLYHDTRGLLLTIDVE